MNTKGQLNVGWLVAAYVPSTILTPFYCYYMAVSQHQEKPYPAATITQTACHYPQDIAFRFFMLLASSILGLTFFMMFNYVSKIAKDAHFPKKISKTLYRISLFSIVLYGITIGTIDSRGTGPLHSPCAVAFFLILIWAIIEVTIYMTELRQFDTSTISRTSLRCKQLLAVYLIVLWIYCIAMIIAVSKDEEWEGKSDKYVVIVQWNTVTIGLLWVLTFCWQWKDMNLVLIHPSGHSSSQLNNRKTIEDRQISLMTTANYPAHLY